MPVQIVVDQLVSTLDRRHFELKNMKLIILTDVFFPDTIGGAGRVVYYLCLELSKKGHENHIITRNINGDLPSYEEFNKNFFVHRFNLSQNESLG